MTVQPQTNDPDFTSRDYWNGLIKMGLSKLFILAAINEQPRHGYDLARRVQEMTRGCCSPTAGALYPALTAFETGGYVTVRSEFHGGRERKVYELTDKGREALAVAIQSWRDASAVLAVPHCPPCAAPEGRV
ncbi:MAG TPA: PadR family transcriptional regulator [Beijerinckiaceae bacterium]|nr:PadR family transcriptional regulator [Beijerinckiaceae bacterium]